MEVIKEAIIKGTPIIQFVQGIVFSREVRAGSNFIKDLFSFRNIFINLSQNIVKTTVEIAPLGGRISLGFPMRRAGKGLRGGTHNSLPPAKYSIGASLISVWLHKFNGFFNPRPVFFSIHQIHPVVVHIPGYIERRLRGHIQLMRRTAGITYNTGLVNNENGNCV
ncbi:hypothetical protein HX99_01220 [Peptococcaceae bacterium SCADC1_2_3]|nr:hypothetical protein HX99_01220 [Peptococcaceae bacterium SCADC1_2_3]